MKTQIEVAEQNKERVMHSLANLYGVSSIPDSSVLPVLQFTMLALNASAEELKIFIKKTEH